MRIYIRITACQPGRDLDGDDEPPEPFAARSRLIRKHAPTTPRKPTRD